MWNKWEIRDDRGWFFYWFKSQITSKVVSTTNEWSNDVFVKWYSIYFLFFLQRCFNCIATQRKIVEGVCVEMLFVKWISVHWLLHRYRSESRGEPGLFSLAFDRIIRPIVSGFSWIILQITSCSSRVIRAIERPLDGCLWMGVSGFAINLFFVFFQQIILIIDLFLQFWVIFFISWIITAVWKKKKITRIHYNIAYRAWLRQSQYVLSCNCIGRVRTYNMFVTKSKKRLG